MKFYLTLFFLFFFSMLSFSQNEKLINKYINSYNEYNKYFQEYFYTQFNKSNYFPGDNIWFQIYIIDKQNQKLSKITKKVYVDLYDSEGKLIERKILKAKNGLANNSFIIPIDYNDKNIFFKVSTDWSKNYSQEFIDEIQINIKPDIIQKNNEVFDSTPKIYFFPESGHLIEDVPTRVGVKVVDQFNNGFFFSGEIEDEKGNLIVVFKTNDLGMGKFTFRPEKNKKYRLRQFFNIDKDQLYLPQIEREGVLFNVLESGDEFRVFFRNNILRSNNLHYYIIYNKYKIAVSGSFNFNGGNISLQKFKKKDLLDGLNTITLFDYNLNPIGERVFFNPKRINFKKNIIEATSNRDKDSINIILYNKGKDSVYQMAISILPKESISQFSSKTFLTDYYLSSEVKGYIENSTYYFKDSENIKELDNLLLTQGWRRYDWKNMLLNPNILVPKDIKFLFETGTKINGKVVNKQNNVPLKNEDVTLFYNNLTEVTITDGLGNFSFVDIDVKRKDTIKLFVNLDKKIRKSIYVNSEFKLSDSIISISSETKRKNIPKKVITIIEENFESNINIYDEGEKLDEVELFVAKDSKKEKIDTYVNPMDNTTFTKSFYINKDNVDKFRSVLSYLESLPGLEIVANGSQIAIYSSRTMQQSILQGAKRPIDIYIDNSKLSSLDIETLGMLDLNKIRNINVNKSGIGYGGENPYGRISIYLNYGEAIYGNRFKKKEDTSNFLEYIIKEGFTENKEYYTPEYKLSPNNELYKKYATIHWQPNLGVTKKGKNFKIKVPDSIDECILLIEGISEEGHIISIKKEFQIK